MDKQNLAWVHRIAGISAEFHAQDMGYVLSVEYTTILGKLPNADTWIVQVDGQETDRGEYWWPTTKYLAISGPETQPHVEDATDAQLQEAVS